MTATLKLFCHFILHMVVAGLLFGVVAGLASLLWYGTTLMEQYHVPYEIWIVCFLVSELLFWLDVVCLLIFVSAQAWKFIVEIYQNLRGK
jgi:hypothetical protein